MSVDHIELWHRRARPNPTNADFQVQLSCHIEEFNEMLDTLEFKGSWDMLRRELNRLQRALREGFETAAILDRKEFLDALADQVVTAVGAGHCAGMRAADAVQRVNASNWSKFDEHGEPIRNEHGKVMKGEMYKPPVLDGCY